MVVGHGTVRRPAGYRWSSSPWPHCRALWPAAAVVGANDHIFLHLISAKRLRSDDPTGAEGRLPFNLRMYPGLICVLTISAVEAREVLKLALWLL